MEVDLTIKDKVINPIIIQHDDLKFDGKTITIPSYWVDNLCEYIKNHNLDKESDADIEDYKLFRSFLWDVQEYKNGGN
jgi:hypothetical protein